MVRYDRVEGSKSNVNEPKKKNGLRFQKSNISKCFRVNLTHAPLCLPRGSIVYILAVESKPAGLMSQCAVRTAHSVFVLFALQVCFGAIIDPEVKGITLKDG